jgi:thiamine-phosphate pyrophosphorylase
MKKLIVFSAPKPMLGEMQTVLDLYKNGMEHLHIRKPGGDEKAYTDFLNKIPKPNRSEVHIHDHYNLAIRYALGGIHYPEKMKDQKGFEDFQTSRSLHSLDEVIAQAANYNYVFYSPVFDSISKEGYSGTLDLKAFQKAREKIDGTVIALGGITSENAAACLDAGFDGVAVLGTLWNQFRTSRMMDELKRLQDICA